MALNRSPEMWLAAYFLSRCGERREGRKPGPPPHLNVGSWEEAYASFFTQLSGGRSESVFHNSLKNARDTFDSHHESGRAGWRDAGGPPQPLTEEGRLIMEAWESRSDDDLWEAVRNFIVTQSTGTFVTDVRPMFTACDLGEVLPERVQTTISRIVRDTDLSNQVKRQHNYECQLCGHSILLADGSGYAEGHHIQPLGYPHNGPDAVANIICVCPNHHAACDYGAIRLRADELRTAGGHEVGEEYIEYHNRVIFRGKDFVPLA